MIFFCWGFRYAYDVVGAVFFGKQFGFLEDRHDYGNYIRSVHQAMPILSVVAQAPSYVRPLLLLGAVAVPRLFKAVMAVDQIKKNAIKSASAASANSTAHISSKHDVLSQLLTMVREHAKEAEKEETKEKLLLTRKEVNSEMFTGMYVNHNISNQKK